MFKDNDIVAIESMTKRGMYSLSNGIIGEKCIWKTNSSYVTTLLTGAKRYKGYYNFKHICISNVKKALEEKLKYLYF